jgi:hypothetical protein
MCKSLHPKTCRQWHFRSSFGEYISIVGSSQSVAEVAKTLGRLAGVPTEDFNVALFEPTPKVSHQSPGFAAYTWRALGNKKSWRSVP